MTDKLAADIARYRASEDAPLEPRFRLHTIAEIMQRRPVNWLIRGILPRGSVALLFGDAAAGKSLVAIDWSACVATGVDWRGHRVSQGGVVYIAGEGHAGLPGRFKAWEVHHGIELHQCEHLRVSNIGAAFRDVASSEEVVQAVEALPEPPALVVVDTLHANFGPGDENSASDMGAFLAGIKRVHEVAPDAVLLIVHHPGHGDKTRARGSYALHGALDAEYRLELIGDTRKLVCTKAKDFEPPNPLASELLAVALPWVDDDGQTIRAPVLAPTDAVPTKARELSPSLRLAFSALVEATGAPPGPNWHGPDPRPREIVTLGAWRTAFYVRHTGDSQSTKQRAFHRARKELADAGAVGVWEDTYWPTPEAGPWPELVGIGASAAFPQGQDDA
jgi:hypothetical protein